MKTLITIIIILAAVFLLFGVLNNGLTRHERAECIKWEQQSRDYPNWYATGWQKEQCNQFGIEL